MQFLCQNCFMLHRRVWLYNFSDLAISFVHEVGGTAYVLVLVRVTVSEVGERYGEIEYMGDKVLKRWRGSGGNVRLCLY